MPEWMKYIGAAAVVAALAFAVRGSHQSAPYSGRYAFSFTDGDYRIGDTATGRLYMISVANEKIVLTTFDPVGGSVLDVKQLRLDEAVERNLR